MASSESIAENFAVDNHLRLLSVSPSSPVQPQHNNNAR